MSVELFSMKLLASSADLIVEGVKGLASGAGNWAANKGLDVLFNCNRCDEPCKCRIGNVAFNDLMCTNCRKHVQQFTNACKFTVKETGSIAHVAARFGDWKWYWGAFNQIRIPTDYLFSGLKGVQIAERNIYTNPGTGEIYSEENHVWTAPSDSYLKSGQMIAHTDLFVKQKLRDTLTSVELRLESRTGDILLQDRYIINLPGEK